MLIRRGLQIEGLCQYGNLSLLGKAGRKSVEKTQTGDSVILI